jgi:hypothetical protein
MRGKTERDRSGVVVRNASEKTEGEGEEPERDRSGVVVRNTLGWRENGRRRALNLIYLVRERLL